MSLQAILPRDHRPLPDKTGIGRSLDITPWRDGIVLGYNGAFARNVFCGAAMRGSEIDASATGTFDLPIWVPVLIDNQGNRISGFDNTNGGTLKVQFRWMLQVTNAAITVTPKIYDITAAADATTSGAAACSATADDFSGSNQRQVLALTLPNAAHEFRPNVVIGGTPAPGYLVRAAVVCDVYVDF